MDRVRRMELKQQSAGGMLRNAAHACVAAGVVLVPLLMLSAMYEALLANTLHLSLDNDFNPHQQLQLAVRGDEDQSFLYRYLSVVFSRAGLEQQPASATFSNLQRVEGDAGVGQIANAEGNVPVSPKVQGYRLPSLKLRFVGNESSTEAKQEEEDEKIVFPSGRFSRGRNEGGAGMGLGSIVVVFACLLLAAVVLFFGVMALQHAAVMGVVAYSVTSTYMRKPVSLSSAVKSLFGSGIVRLIWLEVLHTSLRGQSLFFFRAFLKKQMSSDSVEKLVIRLSVMPFAFLAPFRDKEVIEMGLAARVGTFIAADYVFEALIYTVYVIACWVTIMERDYRGVGAVQRSWNLLKTMQWQAMIIKFLESMLCGRSFRWLLQKFLGKYSSLLIISAADVYFTVLWMVFYFAARSEHEPRFNHSHLEEYLNRIR